MERLSETLRAIQFAGLKNVLRAIRYTLRRDRWERRWRRPPKPTSPTSPGQLQQAIVTPRGGRFIFSNADLEVDFLTPDMVCIAWEPGTPPLPYTITREEWPPVVVALHQATGGWTLAGEALNLIIDEEGSLSLQDSNGHLLRREVPPRRQGRAWIHRARLQPGEHLYGLGERAGPINLRGGSYRLWNRDPGGSYGPGDDPLYLGIPLYIGLHEAGSYLIFYANSHPATCSFSEEAQVQFEGGPLHYYLIVGAPDQALERYSALTGRPPLPPRWALGYHQSRWGYDSADEVRAVIQGFRDHDLPLSALHLDIDYMAGYRVFTVDADRFPDLAGLAADLAEQGLHLVTILDPGVKCDPNDELFEDGLAGGHFCTLPDGRPVFAPVWPGWCAFPDFSDPQTRSWWGEHYPRLLDQGITGFWHDMNEPATFVAWGDPSLPRPTRHALEGRGCDHAAGHNLYGLLMNRAGYEALRRHRPHQRPFILSRSGWAGLQRYAWHWTGDLESTWAGLRQTVATVLGLALSGIPYTGPDIGGFSGAPSAELYLRWLQLATFLPFFRGHSALNVPRREPWSFGQPALEIARRFLTLRYRLLPYLYTLAWQASQRGHPLVRPLFWLDPADADLWDVGDAFLLGDGLLVAPVLEQGGRTRQVRLPKGTWYLYQDDTRRQGPATVQFRAPLEQIPVLVRAGTVLPMEERGRLTLHVYPPTRGAGAGLLYSDAGDGYDSGRLDRFHMVREGARLELIWNTEGVLNPLDPHSKQAETDQDTDGEMRCSHGQDFPWWASPVTLHVHGWRLEQAWIDGGETPIRGSCVETAPFRRAQLVIRPAE